MSFPPEHVRELLEAQIRNNPRRVVQIIDYLVVTTYDHGGRDPAGHSGPVDLPEGVRIERLDSEAADESVIAQGWDVGESVATG